MFFERSEEKLGGKQQKDERKRVACERLSVAMKARASLGHHFFLPIGRTDGRAEQWTNQRIHLSTLFGANCRESRWRNSRLATATFGGPQLE